MKITVNQLRDLAKSVPIFADRFNAAADEIERQNETLSVVADIATSRSDGELFKVVASYQDESFINEIKMSAIREAFEAARIPLMAKAGCIGEFSVTIEDEQVCPECYMEGDNPDCEICHRYSENGRGDLVVDIPWDIQKDIFKAFCGFAAQEYLEKKDCKL